MDRCLTPWESLQSQVYTFAVSDLTPQTRSGCCSEQNGTQPCEARDLGEGTRTARSTWGTFTQVFLQMSKERVRRFSAAADKLRTRREGRAAPRVRVGPRHVAQGGRALGWRVFVQSRTLTQEPGYRARHLVGA